MNKNTTVTYHDINFDVVFHKEGLDDEYLIWSIFVENTDTDLFDMMIDLLDRGSKMSAASEIEILARQNLTGQL